MTTYTEGDILAALDDAQDGDCWEWPDFGHLDYDTLTAPMVVLRDDKRWAIVFCAVEWDTDNALTATIMPVGNCVQIPQPKNYQQLQARYAAEVRREMEAEGEEVGPEFEREMAVEFDQELGYLARRLDSVKVEFDFDDAALENRGFVSAVKVRGEQVDLSGLEIEPDASRDPAFAIGLAVVRKYRDRILANAEEAARFFPDGMPPVFMVIDQWHYAKWVRPSKTELFQQLARAIASNDPACYAPTRAANTEWQVGVEPDWEAEQEEGNEDGRATLLAADLAYIEQFMPPPKGDEEEIVDRLVSAIKAPTLSTRSVDREECIAAFSALYHAMQRPLPEFIFCSSPRDFQQRALGMSKNGQRFEDVAGESLAIASYARNTEPTEGDLRRMRGITGYVSDQLAPFYDLAECVKAAESACIPEGMAALAPRSSCTHNLFDSAVGRQVAEALGLSGDRRMPMQTDRASYTCGGRGLYERYCFIIDRPSRIEHPDLTTGAPEGRCRVEWRDGYAFEVELNGDE